MSYSLETKNECARIKPANVQEAMAELSGILRLAGTLKFRGNQKIDFLINTENPATARKAFSLIKYSFNKTVDIEMSSQSSRKRKLYSLEMKYEDGAMDLLRKLEILDPDSEHVQLKDALPSFLDHDEGAKRAYMRGTFLGGGYIANPEKQYHMEWITSNETYAISLLRLFRSYGFSANMTDRKNSILVYLKDSEAISDMLALIGAHDALMKLESVKVVKQVRNKVHRIVNCETANLNKTVDTAIRQINSIRIIQEKMGLHRLKESYQEIAQLRLDNPEMSLKELGEKLRTPIGKSAVNHRLKKIEEIAEKLKGE